MSDVVKAQSDTLIVLVEMQAVLVPVSNICTALIISQACFGTLSPSVSLVHIKFSKEQLDG